MAKMAKQLYFLVLITELVSFYFLGLLRFGFLGDIVVSSIFLNSKARQLSGESFPVFGVAHSKDNGVKARSSLGHEGRNLRQERCYRSLAANDSRQHNKGIGGPDEGPQGDIGNSNLGNPDFSSFSAIVLES